MKKILYIISSIFCFSCAQNTEGQQFIDVNVQEFKELISREDAVILDVMTPDEYAEGHIDGAINIDFFGNEFDEQIAKLDKGKYYLVYCAAGGRSGKTLKKLKNSNFNGAANLKGGMGAWQSNGEGVTK